MTLDADAEVLVLLLELNRCSEWSYGRTLELLAQSESEASSAQADNERIRKSSIRPAREKLLSKDHQSEYAGETHSCRTFLASCSIRLTSAGMK